MRKYLKLSVVILMVALVAIFQFWISSAAEQNERFLDSGIKVVPQERDVWESYMDGAEDVSLGVPFRQYAMHTQLEIGKEYRSTLVEYPYGISARAGLSDPAADDSPDTAGVANGVAVPRDSATLQDSSVTEKIAANSPAGTKTAGLKLPRGIILYVHGYNDYFFQKELAEKADSAGYAFFAIDLHYCGRSFMPGDPRGDMRNMREFFAELDYGVELARVISGKRAEGMALLHEQTGAADTAGREQRILDASRRAYALPMVLMGHSQGGLLMAYYADQRPEEKFAALVLNSPFLDFNFNWFVREIAIPLVSEVAIFLPDLSIGSTGDPNYAYSLDKNHYGEWEYNTEWKSESRPEQYLGWVRAIHRAQKELRRGFDVKAPTLVMHGDCSEKGEEWSENYTHCDGVLDVELIEKWAPRIGPAVTTETIHDGLHDLYLSRKDVRAEAYAKTFRFIDANVRAP